MIIASRLLDKLPFIGYRRIVSRRLKALAARRECPVLCPRHGDPRDTSVRNPGAERCSKVAA